ncbi:MPN domain-containing protein [Aphelenchoides besseyi]|nr:MPN domain-containing protein [Aphelenchoides besseyi]KAI6220273.1 MPN domain-containing protein [Aphelenchoides besseyi]
MPTVDVLPYCKIALHAVKFPHNAVHGLLVGRVTDDDCVVVDAFPLFHHFVSAPPLEAALIIVDEWCETQKLKIVGSYFANSRKDDETIDFNWAKPLHDKLSANGVVAPVVFRLDNNKLSLNTTNSCIAAYTYDSAKWKQLSTKLANSTTILSTYSAALQFKLHRELQDFETHLEDPNENDFLNENFAKKLSDLMS